MESATAAGDVKGYLRAIRAGDKSALKAAVRADIDGAYDVLTGLL